MKALIKALIAKTPYRVVRDYGANRFDAFEACFSLLVGLGYRPNVILDGGAHLGAFATQAQRHFPGAEIHLIEPQPACQPALAVLAAERGFHLHPFALGSAADEAAGQAQMVASETPSTGSHLGPPAQGESVTTVAVATLDRLFADLVAPDDRTFLKLDLQGYELHALQGAARLLSNVEVILSEVSFFAQSIEPSIVELIGFLDQAGFDLFDVAALGARRRDNRLRQGDFLFVRRGSPVSADTRWA